MTDSEIHAVLIIHCLIIVFIVPDKPNFPEEEEKVLKFWEDTDAFHQQLKLSEGKPEFTFYDGPPFATGLPHYGHIAAGTIKVSGLNPGGQAIQRVNDYLSFLFRTS